MAVPRRAFRFVCPILATSVLTACGTTPSKVAMPQKNNAATAQNAANERYLVKGKTLKESDLDVPFPYPTSYLDVVAQLDAHYAVWSDEASTLAAARDNLGNTQFGGAVAAAVGVLADKTGLATTGAAVAGGAGIWDSRYKLTVQSTNYRAAADAVDCMSGLVSELPRGFWESTYAETGNSVGTMLHGIEFYDDGKLSKEDLNAAYDTLSSLFLKVGQSIREVTKRLRKLQEGTILGTPSASDIRSALSATAHAEGPASMRAQAIVAGTARAAVESTAPPPLPQRGTAPAGANMGKTPNGAAPLSPSAVQEYNDALARYATTWKAVKPDFVQDKQAQLRQSADLGTAVFKKALLLPSKLEECTKRIGPA